MSVCPNCGAYTNGAKFCESCGAPLPVEQFAQPVQQAQRIPVQPQPAQPVEPQPVYQQPAYQQPVYQQPVPVQPVYQQPVYNQAYQMPGSYNPVQKKSTNGACIAGFILGLVGLFTFGLTSLVGFIVSTIGVIIAFAKKQKGKVLGIIGLVLSLLLCVGWILFIANADKISAWLDANGEGSSFEEWLFEDSYDGKIEIISETDWIRKDNGSYLVFGADDQFTYYADYRVLDNNYNSGTYEICFGYEAMDIIEGRYSKYGITADDICDEIENERGIDGVAQFMVLVLHNDGLWINGENTVDVKWDTVYMGYYDADRNVMDLRNPENNTEYTFIPYSNFDKSSIVMPDLNPTETNAFGEDYWGDNVVGVVKLYEGDWTESDETDAMDYSYLEMLQMYNADTETRIQLSVISGEYDPSLAEEMAEEFQVTMEEFDYYVSEVEEISLGGYTAYEVSAQYDDGKYLTVWYFVDGDLAMHYITAEYYESDIAAYEMVRDTYVYEQN